LPKFLPLLAERQFDPPPIVIPINSFVFTNPLQAAAAEAAEQGGEAEASVGPGPISVIGGIGREAIAKKTSKKKRTPGEIRIQKGGTSALEVIDLFFYVVWGVELPPKCVRANIE
jgi:hypothetical protein